MDSIKTVSYNATRRCQIICPLELLRLMNNFIPYENVTDDMIQHYLTTQSFTNLKIPHKGYKTSNEEHAQRIATLISLIEQGIHIQPVDVYINEDFDNEIEDGHHRFRAYLYLNKYMPIFLNPPE